MCAPTTFDEDITGWCGGAQPQAAPNTNPVQRDGREAPSMSVMAIFQQLGCRAEVAYSGKPLVVSVSHSGSISFSLRCFLCELSHPQLALKGEHTVRVPRFCVPYLSEVQP